MPILIEGLKRLEYRGYDSAGVAVINGTLQRLRSCGRVAELEKLAGEQRPARQHRHRPHALGDARRALRAQRPPARLAAASRWCTTASSRTTTRCARACAALGYEFTSDTDTEVIAHLVHSHAAATGEPVRRGAARRSRELVGAYAIAVIAADDPQRMVVARMGAPLLLGLGDGENFAASDTSALLQVTRRMIYLEEGDCAEVTLESVRIVDARGHVVERPLHVSQLAADAIELGTLPALHAEGDLRAAGGGRRDARGRRERARASRRSSSASARSEIFEQIDSALILACGTSYHAGMVARYWLESLAGMPCNVEIASEYRYRDIGAEPAHAGRRHLAVGRDRRHPRRAAARARASASANALAICNVPESALVRSSQPEIPHPRRPRDRRRLDQGVHRAARRAAAAGAGRWRSSEEATVAGKEVEDARGAAQPAGVRSPTRCASSPRWRRWAAQFARCEHALFLGRGVHYPIAMEGALKLKEISYIHAEAYAAGELKHGPLALVDRNMPVVAIAPQGRAARQAEVEPAGGARARRRALRARRRRRGLAGEGVHVVPHARRARRSLSPIVSTVPLQLLAYHAALLRGNDVDKPRNLAKSVTVE